MHWIAPAKTDTATATPEERYRAAGRERQIQNLRLSRDVLLTGLLSGQVELAQREASA